MPTNRREFLKKTAKAAVVGATALLFIPTELLGRGGAIPPNSRINVACIGVGGMGTGNLRLFLNREPARVVAVCDVDRAHALAAQDIYCEKPLAYTVREGRAIVDAVRQSGVVWQTGSWQRSIRDLCGLARHPGGPTIPAAAGSLQTLNRSNFLMIPRQIECCSDR